MGAYGWPSFLGKPDYETWVGLELNAERVELRRAWNVALGVGLSTTRGPIDRAYFDAACAEAEEVERAMGRANALRRLAEMRGGR